MTTESDRGVTPTEPTGPTQSSPVGPVTEQKLDRNRELANALPSGTREDIDRLQTQLQGVPEEQVKATVEEIRAAPEETLDRLRSGDAIVPAPNPTQKSVPVSPPE